MALAESAREIEAHSWHPATIPLDDEHALPLVGHVYADATGRKFRVDALDLGAPDGRQVVGAIEVHVAVDGDLSRTPVTNERRADAVCGAYPFTTSLPIWAAIWRDHRPPLDPSKAKIG